MTIRTKKRTLVSIISYSAAAFALLIGFVIKSNSQVAVLKRQIVHTYEASLESLSISMENMAVTLEKSLYAGTASGLNNLTGDLILQAGTAEEALSSLPLKTGNVSTVAKFISQVSDFLLSITKKSVAGNSITESERKSLKSLADTAALLSNKLGEISGEYNSYENWDKNISGVLDGIEATESISKSMDEVEKSLSDYPTLIYDGPFSDHISLKESKLLKNCGSIDNAAAKRKAADVLNISENSLKYSGMEDGKMESYIFDYQNGRIAITKKGGYVSYFRNDREIANNDINYEKAVGIALKYVNSLGLGNFKESYYFTDEGICVVNFATVQNGVLCYTDLIKVGVALDNGEIVLYESRGYIMNHYDRKIESPKQTQDEAKKVLSPHLKVNSVKKALIPSDGLEERLCYEFACTGEKNEEVLVYVNCSTLIEENMFILLKTDGGTLVK